MHPMRLSSSYSPAIAEKLRAKRTAKWGDGNVHCCTYFCLTGYCFWTDWDNDEGASDWQGHEGLGESGTIGLLLDLDEGTLSVFKNSRRLGVMKDRLDGEYVWFASVYSCCTISMARSLVPN